MSHIMCFLVHRYMIYILAMAQTQVNECYTKVINPFCHFGGVNIYYSSHSNINNIVHLWIMCVHLWIICALHLYNYNCIWAFMKNMSVFKHNPYILQG